MSNRYNKKHPDLSIEILKPLAFFANIKGELFEKSQSEEDLITIIDKDLNSTFHFIVMKYNPKDKKFLVSKSPYSVRQNSANNLWVRSQELKTHFENWVRLMEEITNIEEPFGDKKIFEGYQKEYYDYFEFVDEQDKERALNSTDAIAVYNWLENLDARLLEYKTDENASIIKDVQNDIIHLKENLTVKSKEWVVNKIAFIWAKITVKGGVAWMKKFIGELGNEARKQSIKELINWGKDLIG